MPSFILSGAPTQLRSKTWHCVRLDVGFGPNSGRFAFDRRRSGVPPDSDVPTDDQIRPPNVQSGVANNVRLTSTPGLAAVLALSASRPQRKLSETGPLCETG